MLVLDGPISDRAMQVHGKAWQETWTLREDAPGQPEKHQIAAQGIAVITNAANPLKRLSVDQLQQIVNGKARTWQDALVGSDVFKKTDDPWVQTAETINVYTPGIRGPEVSLLREHLLDGRYYRWWKRQKSGDEVVRKVAGDPYAVGVISVANIPSESTAIRVLAIAPEAAESGQEQKAVLPSRETVFSGAYPLSRQLTVYVSPKATEVARDFVEFLVTGGESAANVYVDVPQSLSEAMAKHGLLSTRTEIVLPTPEAPKPRKKEPSRKHKNKKHGPVDVPAEDSGGGGVPGGW
ncbi:MAG: substrate-binding domain-containing protein [Phycisphaerae bacterium]|nr:substrate-binding domain-containing protein [Phycisphaerae bacterium]